MSTDKIVAFPSPTDRFDRIVLRLESIGTRVPAMAPDVMQVLKELSSLILSIDSNFSDILDQFQEARLTNERMLALSEAVAEICPSEDANRVQEAYQRRLAERLEMPALAMAQG